VAFDDLPAGTVVGGLLLNGRVVQADPVLRFAVVDVPSASQALALARGIPAVRYAEVEGTYEAYFTPNDPRFAQQYGPARIGLPEAWDLGLATTKSVCIVDTGTRWTHEDLAGSYVAGRDEVNNDDLPDDDHGHGTHVAGTALARIHNGVGVAGAANAPLYVSKVLSSQGWGTWGWVASGIRWCADAGADVVSMSLGGGFSQIVEDAVAYAAGKGVLLIAAAGNSGYYGQCIECVGWPAASPHVVAVGCTDQTDQACFFTSLGGPVEIAAPGYQIVSTAAPDLPTSGCGGGGQKYSTCSGTSMATPHASGLAALVWGHAPSLSACQIRHVLRLTATDLGPAGWDETFGYGLVQARAAIDLAVAVEQGTESLPSRCDFTPPTCVLAAPANEARVSGLVTVRATTAAGVAPVVAADYVLNRAGVASPLAEVAGGAFEGALETATVAERWHRLSVRCIDADGFASGRAAWVLVDNLPDPVVRIVFDGVGGRGDRLRVDGEIAPLFPTKAALWPMQPVIVQAESRVGDPNPKLELGIFCFGWTSYWGWYGGFKRLRENPQGGHDYYYNWNTATELGNECALVPWIEDAGGYAYDVDFVVVGGFHFAMGAPSGGGPALPPVELLRDAAVAAALRG